MERYSMFCEKCMYGPQCQECMGRNHRLNAAHDAEISKVEYLAKAMDMIFPGLKGGGNGN